MTLPTHQSTAAPRRPRPGWWLRLSRPLVAVLSLFALTVSAAPAVAHQAPAAPAAHPAGSSKSCGKLERILTLMVEQYRVLSLVSDFLVLRNERDMERLAELNPRTGTQFAFLSHMYASMEGNGVTVVNVGELGPGKPAFISYRPNPRAKDVLDPHGPDYPYTLAGWGYVAPYTPGEHPEWPKDPGLRCLTEADWFVHERGVHPADTWHYIPLPPEEEFQGQVPGQSMPTPEECQCEIGIPHGRFWDVHFWFQGFSPIPAVSFANPGRPIPGWDPEFGTGFFVPETPPPGSDYHEASGSDHDSSHGSHGHHR